MTHINPDVVPGNFSNISQIIPAMRRSSAETMVRRCWLSRLRRWGRPCVTSSRHMSLQIRYKQKSSSHEQRWKAAAPGFFVAASASVLSVADCEVDGGTTTSDKPCTLSWVQENGQTQAETRVCTSNRLQQPSCSSPKEADNVPSFNPTTTKFYEIKLSANKEHHISKDLHHDNDDAIHDEENSTITILHNTVVVIPNLLTEHECHLLINETERILIEEGVTTEKWAMYHRFNPTCQAIMNRLLRKHVLEFILQRLPPVVAERLRLTNHHDVIPSKSMEFYWDYPVVIKYLAGNHLAPHNDMRELTIIIPLNPSDDFPLEGGGTRFWFEGTIPDDANQDDGVSIIPSAGSGIIFNGDITHSGNAVIGGTRFVFMTSINLDDDGDYDDTDDNGDAD